VIGFQARRCASVVASAHVCRCSRAKRRTLIVRSGRERRQGVGIAPGCASIHGRFLYLAWRGVLQAREELIFPPGFLLSRLESSSEM
jgi:hypothetical protein